MLRRLQIDNLTVFESVEAEFSAGLNVITGETGAGKTMLLQALQLVSGGKANSDLIGPASNSAYAEASFDDPPPEAVADTADADEELVLARKLRKDAPARALCNGRSVSSKLQQQAAESLISLTGQHAARQLTSSTYQLQLIDDAHPQQLGKVADAYSEVQSLKQQLTQLQESMLDRKRQIESLQYEQQLFEQLDPDDDEYEQLQVETQRLQHADQLAQAALQIKAQLTDDDSILEHLDELISVAAAAGAHDPNLQSLHDQIVDARERLSDCAYQSSSLSESYQADPDRLEEIQMRLNDFAELRRRFANLSIAEIRIRIEEGAHQLSLLLDADQNLQSLQEQIDAAEKKYQQAAEELSKSRRSAARKLSKKVEQHLHDLSLTDARLIVDFDRGKSTRKGFDTVNFLLQVNPGLKPAALSSGASGGELSRVNLAILLATSASHVYLFDEVDAGIGGQTAHVVAEKLKQLSRHSQVIVITHLAQIAVSADKHLVVEKKADNKRAITTLRELATQDEREQEIARLMGASVEQAQDAARLIKSGSITE